MSTEPTEVVTGDDPQAKPEATAEPERSADLAPPEAEAAQSESSELTPEKRLELAERTIKRLERRAEKLAGKARDAAIERDQLRQQRTTPQEDDDPEPADIERIASQRAQEIVQGQALEKRAAALLQAGKKLDGFEAAVTALREEVPFTDSKGRVTPFLEAVLESDAPAAIVQYLGKNPEEAAEFDGLTPLQIGRRLARLEDKLKQEGTVKTSKAPAPIEPIKGNGSPVSPEMAKMTFSEYEKARAKQGAAWSRFRS